MAPAQLSRLRPQISALSSLFEHPQTYIKSLTTLLEQYRSEIEVSADGISPHSLIKKMNVPEIVISQLIISFNHLVKTFPQQTIEIAKEIWNREYFEYKQLSIHLLSKLPGKELPIYLDHLAQWVKNDTEAPILTVILETARENPELQRDSGWLELISAWVASEDIRLKKIGLRSITDLIKMENQFPDPARIRKIRPAFSNPGISINLELMEITKLMASLSLNETAAFLISLGIQNPDPETKKFLRKCAQFFPPALSERIKSTAQV
jgi:hypothetical protein